MTNDGPRTRTYHGNMNLADNLTATAARVGGKTALRLDDREVTYRQLDATSARVAGLLRTRGVEPGDRVGIMLPNVPEFATVYYGVLRAGAIVVPMNVLLKEREVRFYLRDSSAKLMFAWHSVAEAAEAGAREVETDCLFVTPGEFERLLAHSPVVDDVCECEASDTAVIIYTSGTTGTPKGAELTHLNLASNASAVTRMYPLLEQDIVFGALPLFHSFGQTCAMNASVAAGSSLSLIARFEPGKVLETIGRDRVTIFLGVPTMYSALLNHPDRESFDYSSLRICVSGGASLPVEVLHGFDRAFDCKVLEGYGLSETSPVASFNHPDRERKPGSIGTPIEHVEMEIVDEDGHECPLGEVGEIVIRGPNVMKGYWNRPAATRETIKDGWLYTGDLAKVDEDGFFFIVDRKKDMIIRGGYNVYPREVEEVFYEHPAVEEIAVIAVPHESLGEEVAAAIVLKRGHEADPDELREFVKARVAAYKYPRLVWVLDELPKGPTGKIVKREIKAPAAAGAEGHQPPARASA
jgi:long-chain acyl-CoA synthetase